MQVIRPDTEDQSYPASVTVFLAGAIENGKAAMWAHEVIQMVSDIHDLTLFDPRREKWLPDIEKRAHNPVFRKQVEWELAHLEGCDIPFFYFLPGSKSPITLQELGFVIGSRSESAHPRELPIVVCPDGFWRKGNVEIMCERYGIDVFENLEQGVEELRNVISRQGARVEPVRPI